MAYFRDIFAVQPHPKFWIKTFLHLVTPGGYGHIRKLQAGRNSDYVHERDKHEVRYKHHGAGGWKDQKEDGILKRDYASYDEYLTHQKLKLDEMVKMKGGFSNFDIFDYRLKFYLRFRHLQKLLPSDAAILCCGARQGTEVDVLRDLGFRNARGIDLIPVRTIHSSRFGDMMKLDYPDNSLDLLYTNCVDHAFDLDKLVEEHAPRAQTRRLPALRYRHQHGRGGGAFEAISGTALRPSSCAC